MGYYYVRPNVSTIYSAEIGVQTMWLNIAYVASETELWAKRLKGMKYCIAWYWHGVSCQRKMRQRAVRDKPLPLRPLIMYTYDPHEDNV